MRKTRMVLAALLIAVVAVGIVGAQAKKVLYVAYDRELDVLNPFTSQMLCDVQHNVSEGLIITNDKNEFIPVLAKEIPTMENGGIKKNADGTYDMTWHLHQGVKWSDGVEFTAEDVKFTLDFVHNTPEVYNQSEYNKIKSATILDKYTIVMKWDGLYTFYAGIFEAMLPKHILSHLSWKDIAKFEPFNRGPKFIGTGPFMFKEWKSGEYIRLVRNPNYWRGQQYPKLDEMVFQFIPDQNARFNAMQSGRYHVGQIEATQVKNFKTRGLSVKMIPSNVFYYIGFNIGGPGGRPDLFGDIRVRKAFYHAIDRKAIVDLLLEGTVKIANSPIPPASAYHNPNIQVPEYNPAKAKQLLAEAGWKDTNNDGILDKNGVNFSFKWLNRSGRADRIAISQVVQAQLKEIGIDSTMVQLEAAAWSQKWRNFEYEVQVGGWFMSSDSSITNYYHTKDGKNGSNNFSGFGNPELDAIMIQSDKVLDYKSRKPLLDKAQQMLIDEARDVFLYYRDSPWVVSDRLTNFRGSGTNLGNWWNTWDWDLQ